MKTNNTNSPLVSILMTAYNREEYIGEAIESVLSNSYQNFELIIVDDGSKDSTMTIAQSYESTDKRVKVFQNEKNLGDYANRNKAVSHALGEFFIFVDSDDKLYPDSLDRLINDVKNYPDFKFGMYCNQYKNITVISGDAALKRHFSETQFLFIGPGGTIMKKSFFREIGGYPEKYGPANDMFFNLKVCCNTSIMLIPYDFFFYRRHEGQEINNIFSYMYNNYIYMRDALNDLPLPFSNKQISWLKKKNKRRFVVNLIKYFYKTRNLKMLIIALKKAEFSFFDFFQSIFH